MQKENQFKLTQTYPRTPPAHPADKPSIEFDVDMASLKSQQQTAPMPIKAQTPHSVDLQMCFPADDINETLRSDNHNIDCA